jgi:hypothetical protein
MALYVKGQLTQRQRDIMEKRGHLIRERGRAASDWLQANVMPHLAQNGPDLPAGDHLVSYYHHGCVDRWTLTASGYCEVVTCDRYERRWAWYEGDLRQIGPAHRGQVPAVLLTIAVRAVTALGAAHDEAIRCVRHLNLNTDRRDGPYSVPLCGQSSADGTRYSRGHYTDRSDEVTCRKCLKVMLEDEPERHHQERAECS